MSQQTDTSPAAIKTFVDSYSNAVTHAWASHAKHLLTALSAERDRLVVQVSDEKDRVAACEEECQLLEQEKNMLEDDVEPLNQELSERHKILMQLQAERDALKATVARLCEAAEFAVSSLDAYLADPDNHDSDWDFGKGFGGTYDQLSDAIAAAHEVAK